MLRPAIWHRLTNSCSCAIVRLCRLAKEPVSRGHFSQNCAYRCFITFFFLYVCIYNLYDRIEAIGFLTSSATGRTFILEPNWHIVAAAHALFQTERERERVKGCLKQKVPVLTFFAYS